MKIKNITKENFTGKVYNFHCLPNENYFSHNMLVHNCYKGNTAKKAGNNRNMSLDTFKKVMDKFPKTICQIAFGITSLDANPDMFPIYDYCREIGIIPNMTISSADNPSDEIIDRIINTCGAIAISVYGNQPKETRYNLIRRFIKAGMNKRVKVRIEKNKYEIVQNIEEESAEYEFKEMSLDEYIKLTCATEVDINNVIDIHTMKINIHYVVHKSSLKTAYEVCVDLVEDPTLKGLNALIFLGLKPKARGQAFEITFNNEFEDLVNLCFNCGIRFGFDSCSAAGFEKAVLENPKFTDEQKKFYVGMSERCESSRLSAYINVVGEYCHCSFGEDMEKGWGISLLKEDIDFMKDVWHHENSKKFRAELKTLNCECPLFPEIRIENRHGNKP